MALWNCSDFHHLGESVFCRNVCAGDRKASVSGTFSAYSAVSAPPRENPGEESRVNKGLLCSNTEVFMSWPHSKFAKYAKWPTSFPLRTLREVESPRSVSQASTWITVKNADAPITLLDNLKITTEHTEYAKRERQSGVGRVATRQLRSRSVAAVPPKWPCGLNGAAP